MPVTTVDINAMDKRYRAQFINSLSGYKSANLIGTIDAQGQTNLAIMSSAFHLGATPPLMGLIVRPDVAERHTLDKIRDLGVYTISHVNQDIVTQAHQTSARYPKTTSEFEAVGLTPEYIANFPAPAVQESVIKMGLELREEQLMKINGTHLIIGEIVWVEVPTEVVAEDGYVQINETNTVALSGLDAYFSTEPLQRLPYAKPPA